MDQPSGRTSSPSPRTILLIAAVALGSVLVSMAWSASAQAAVAANYAGNVIPCPGGSPIMLREVGWVRDGDAYVPSEAISMESDDFERAIFRVSPAPSPDHNWILTADGWMIANRSTQCAAPVGSDQRLQQAAGVAPLPSTSVLGTVHATYLQMIAERLSRTPLAASRATNNSGSAGLITDGRRVDLVPGYRYLAGGVTPEGERHWEDVPGVGTGPNKSFGYLASGVADISGAGHGSNSLVLHEYAHNVDAADGFVSTTDIWKTGPHAEAQFCSAVAYTRTYPAEWFAAAFDFFSESPRTNAQLADRCPKTHAFLQERYGAPRFNNAYKGWTFAVSRTGATTIRAFRHTANGYVASTLPSGSWIYISPYGAHDAWRWAWQNGSWYAVATADTGFTPRTRVL